MVRRRGVDQRVRGQKRRDDLAEADVPDLDSSGRAPPSDCGSQPTFALGPLLARRLVGTQGPAFLLSVHAQYTAVGGVAACRRFPTNQGPEGPRTDLLA